MYGVSKNSHKKQKDSLETRTVLIEIFLLFWNLRAAQNTGDAFKKNIPFPDSLKIIGCLQVILVLIWMKQTLICFNLQRDGTGNGLSNIKDAFAESLQLQISVLHQSISIFHSSRLVSKVHMMTGQNVKKNYLMCQISIKMLKQHATLNSSLHNLKVYLFSVWPPKRKPRFTAIVIFPKLRPYLPIYYY